MNKLYILLALSDMKWVEVLGQIASITILIALLMPSIKKLRIINSFGAAMMLTYGILIAKYPIVIMNAGSLLINLFHLVKMIRMKYKITHIDFHKDDNYLIELINQYSKINIELNTQSFDIATVIYANMEPINVIFKNIDNKVVKHYQIKKRDRKKSFDIYVNNLLNNN